MRRFLPLPAFLFLLVMSQPAAAASWAVKAREAKKACISGDYAKGVEILSELYVETNDLNYVFNQGRCFEQNGRYQDAINRFHEYARKLKDSGRPADPDVERHIADYQAMLDRQTGAAATPAPTAAPATLPAPEGKATEPAIAPVVLPPQVEVVHATPSARKPGAALRIVGLAAVGLGVAGLAAGVALNVKANGLVDDLERSDTSYSRNKESTRSSY